MCMCMWMWMCMWMCMRRRRLQGRGRRVKGQDGMVDDLVQLQRLVEEALVAEPVQRDGVQVAVVVATDIHVWYQRQHDARCELIRDHGGSSVGDGDHPVFTRGVRNQHLAWKDSRVHKRQTERSLFLSHSLSHTHTLSPVHQETSMPDASHEVPLPLARQLQRRLGQVEAEALGDAHRRPDNHPRLVRVVGALQVLAHEEQALDELDGARVPEAEAEAGAGAGAEPEQLPRPREVPLAGPVPLLRGRRLDELRRERQDDVEGADKGALVGVDRRAGEERPVRVLEPLPVQEGIQRVDVVPVELHQVVGLLPGREDVVGRGASRDAVGAAVQGQGQGQRRTEQRALDTAAAAGLGSRAQPRVDGGLDLVREGSGAAAAKVLARDRAVLADRGHGVHDGGAGVG
ncbi:hypothetical protein CTA2_10237, partial [Colletotrichum tanaceti]